VKTIINSKGVPGTLGCIAYDYQSRVVLLTAYHVLFAEGARTGEKVWLMDSARDMSETDKPVARSLYGTQGVIDYEGKSYLVDCAVALCTSNSINLFNNSSSYKSMTVPIGPGKPELGQKVGKWGSASGYTSGVITDVQFVDSIYKHGQILTAPNQILIRSLTSEPFSVKGDSGAAIMNEKNEIIGLLWGVTCRGEGVACPIAPVLHEMGISL
jgi:hypothetical protein